MRFRPLTRFSLAALAGLALAGAALAGDLEDGLALKAAGKFEEALPKLQKASDADPASAAAALALSEVLAGLGKYEQASRALAKALEAHPDDPALMVARARALMLSANKAAREGSDPNMILATVADADKWVRRALEKDPKNSGARTLKAQVYQHQGGGDAPEALSLFEEVSKDDPKCFDAPWELGQAAVRKARGGDKASWAVAEKWFRAAHAADPASGQALLQATYAKAWQQVAKAPELVGDYVQCAGLLRGEDAPLLAIWKLRKFAAAEVRAALEKLAKDPAHGTRPNAYLALLDGDGALAAGKPDGAVTAYARAASEFPAGDGKDVYFALYNAVIKGALDADQREKICEAAWKRWPQRSEIPNDFAFWCRDGAHDYKRAAKWYLRASEAAPQSPKVLNDTGLIFHYHLNEFDRAEEWYRKAIAAAEEQGVEPSNDPANEGMGYRDALNNMGRLLAQQKKWKDLRKFAEDHVPEGFPGREQWLNAGDK